MNDVTLVSFSETRWDSQQNASFKQIIGSRAGSLSVRRLSYFAVSMRCLAACKIVVPNAFENSSQHSGSLDPAGNEEENRVRGGGNRVICVGTFVHTVLLPVKIC
jgi:hypothetical protein